MAVSGIHWWFGVHMARPTEARQEITFQQLVCAMSHMAAEGNKSSAVFCLNKRKALLGVSGLNKKLAQSS